ncbi:MAG: Mur ligase family protein [Candidatus Dormiibacterota bacterium]|jgi:UDP-N-acetylmuramoylalanine--D-glutamate ligase
MEAPSTPAAAAAERQEGRHGLRVPEALVDLRHSRVDLVGVASLESGEMARYLRAAGFTNLVGHDQQPDRESLERAHNLAHAGLSRTERRQRLAELLDSLSSLRLGDAYLAGVAESAMIIPTQAWFLSPANATLQRLRQRGHPFYSLIQAYLDLARGEVIGITGSHGKSTTSALVAAILRDSSAFSTVWLAGNDRHDRQALQEVARDSGAGCLVLEISNRQLLQMDRAPRVGCITNISPNHLEEHGGMAGYVLAKRRIFDLPGCQVAVRNGSQSLLPVDRPLAEGIRELRFAAVEADLGGLDGAFEEGGEVRLRWQGRVMPVLPTDDVPLAGEHNLANVRAALTVLAGVTDPRPETLARAAAAIAGFRPLRHRTELVRQHLGVEYFDDLSSTTPQSTVAAIEAIGRPCVLIAGGEDKGIDFSGLAAAVGAKVHSVVLLPGAGSERLARELALSGCGTRLHLVNELQAGVELARDLAQPGDAVLLSPACPGFFTAHYREAGFRRAVREATSPRPRKAPG